MHAGRIVARGSPGELKRNVMTGAVFELECSEPVDALAALRNVPAARETAIFGTRLHVNVESDGDAPIVVRALESAGISVRSCVRIVPSLEDVFIRLIKGDEG